MRAIVDRNGLDGTAASRSQMARFETVWVAGEDNLAALTDLSGAWLDEARRRAKTIILDLDSSVSPTHGEQEGSSYNGHFGCICYHPLFVFNQFGDLECCVLRPGPRMATLLARIGGHPGNTDSKHRKLAVVKVHVSNNPGLSAR